MVNKIINANTMPTHWMWYLIWPILGALVMGWGYNFLRIQNHHSEAMAEFRKFKNVGPRFTAGDGQELCLRVQKMDGLPCEYDQ